MSFREVDTAFHEYSNISQTVTFEDSVFVQLQRFVVLMYHASSTADDVNQARRILFTKMNRTIENVPLAANALQQHLKRTIYQCSIWKNCLTRKPEQVDPCQWGWKKAAEYKPLWTTLSDVSTSCRQLVPCKCKKRCTRCPALRVDYAAPFYVFVKVTVQRVDNE